MTISGIYAIVSPSGKRYVGSAKNMRQRWATHRSLLRRNRHHCPGLQAAANKYGVGALIFIMTDAVEPSALIAAEQVRIDQTPKNMRYNGALVAGSSLGCRHSDASRAKQSAARKGVPKSVAHRAAISKGHLGKKLSPEHCANIGRSVRERIVTPATRAKLSAARLGGKHSLESRTKRSQALTDRKQARNTSGYVGVSLCHGKWQAHYKVLGRRIHVGTYLSAEAASVARTEAMARANAGVV